MAKKKTVSSGKSVASAASKVKALASKAVEKISEKVAAKSKPKLKTSITYKVAVGSEVDTGSLLPLRTLKSDLAVLYFYPKDNTPGCTLEGHDFKRLHSAFKKVGCEVYGVSRDSEKSHENFKTKCGFPFALIADVEGELCREFDVIQMKSLYGRKFEGIERSTFVIDKKGVIRAEWRKVKVIGHADEVLESVKMVNKEG